MGKKQKAILTLLVLGIIAAIVLLFLHRNNIVVLNPQGEIANKQRDLMIFTFLLGMIVVIPVFAMTFYIAWKYRAGNKKAKYQPNWDHSKKAEIVWWGVPLALILVLSVVTWKSSHDLDPYKALVSDAQPIEIQAVALDWKWLFIYPEQNIATVNYLQIPEKRPINFKITADAPMNSFWIPKLGGQVYAMAGMETKLHLMADETGVFRGSSSNISGKGFAGMHFDVRASSEADFENWINKVKHSPNKLGAEEYAELAKPSQNHKITLYRSRQAALYDNIMMKYMMPADQHAAHTSVPAESTERTHTKTKTEPTRKPTEVDHAHGDPKTPGAAPGAGRGGY